MGFHSELKCINSGAEKAFFYSRTWEFYSRWEVSHGQNHQVWEQSFTCIFCKEISVQKTPSTQSSITDCPWVQSAFNESVRVGTEESCAWVTPTCTPYAKRVQELVIRVQTMLQFWTFRERTFSFEKDIARFSDFEVNKEPAHSRILANQSKLLLLSLKRGARESEQDWALSDMSIQNEVKRDKIPGE